jgi:hypothetical protein
LGNQIPEKEKRSQDSNHGPTAHEAAMLPNYTIPRLFLLVKRALFFYITDKERFEHSTGVTGYS